MPTTAMLQAWLRTLWDIAPPLHPVPAADTPFLGPAGLHLPIGHPSDDLVLAAAAHAGAHLVYSRPGAAVESLRPTSRALAGLLEDARIEWLAGRELPGLRRLWASLHTASPADGASAEALMQRLARALADERYVDPHPWVAKGRRLMFLDDGQQVLALRQFEAVRQAASRLGNDLGQMRLPLNARTYRPPGGYRDDNQWLWAADEPPEARAPEDGGGSCADRAATVVATSPDERTRHYPEWDRRIACHRPDWATVVERVAPSVAGVPPVPGNADTLRRRLGDALKHRHGPARRRLRHQPDGDGLDLEALVRSWTGHAAGNTFDPRVHTRALPQPRPADVLLMVDTSASSADAPRPGAPSLLQTAREAARLCGQALEHAGHGCAIQAFCSDGRAAVQVERVKDFGDPMDARCAARLAGLRSRWSTRLGAAIRHGTRALLDHTASRARHLVLITDGEPNDIDVFEPHYLAEDARQAVREARRSGVRVFCFSLQTADSTVLRRIFGARQHSGIVQARQLPLALARLCL